MSIRYVSFHIGVFVGLLLLASCSVFLPEGNKRTLEADEERVVGLPKGFVREASLAYRGPHPATINRPQDHFSFPIEVGEIGPVDPLFAGEHQYPFLCQTEESYLGQPLVDNREGVGIPIYAVDELGAKTTKRIGYSKDCSLPTRIQYRYNRKGSEKFYPLEQANQDINQIEVNGKLRDFVVRIETGTINRFIYVIITLRGDDDIIEKADLTNWNRVLVYQFNGGIGVGFNQGEIKVRRLLRHRYEQLAKGYAVVYSTGNETDNHYNIWLQEDTALRVKKQFEHAYAKPDYTVGIGGSGGGLQQYLLAQNRPGLLDAAIPQYSYPDMVTQTTYALDCDPLEYYFDVTDSQNSLWDRWENRSKIEGLSAKSMDDPPFAFAYRFAKLLQGRWPSAPTGSSECSQAWRGPAQIVQNPHFSVKLFRYKKPVYRKTHWSHWEDVKSVYGASDDGFARSTWDNVGVQYGLSALKDNQISIASFLDINKKIGGWRRPQQMRKARFWFIDGRTDMLDFSLWSQHNLNLRQKGEAPALRTQGDVAAIEAAYRSGMVFLGKIDIPVIDIRHYLDGQLDMHHSFASLATRQRIIGFDGDASDHAIWVAHKDYDVTARAFDAMHQWMKRRAANADSGLAIDDVEDTCFDAKGGVIASGDGVWDGQWNHKTNGACSKRYPPFKTSRQVAGEDVKGLVLKCELQSVELAISNGVYGPVDMHAYKRQVEVLFPDGVCDYSKPGVGFPRGLFNKPILWVHNADMNDADMNRAEKANAAKEKVVADESTMAMIRRDEKLSEN